MDACAECGQPSQVIVLEIGAERRLCLPCTNRAVGIAGLEQIVESMNYPRRRNEMCPFCSSLATEVAETGLVGCPLCYSAFDDSTWAKLGVKKGTWRNQSI